MTICARMALCSDAHLSHFDNVPNCQTHSFRRSRGPARLVLLRVFADIDRTTRRTARSDHSSVLLHALGASAGTRKEFQSIPEPRCGGHIEAGLAAYVAAVYRL